MRFLLLFFLLISSFYTKAQCDGCRLSIKAVDCNLFVYDSSTKETYLYDEVRSYNSRNKTITLVNSVGSAYNIKHENISQPNLSFDDLIDWLETNLFGCNASMNLESTDQDTFALSTCFIATSDGTGYLEGQEISRLEWYTDNLNSAFLTTYEVLSTGASISPPVSDLIGCHESLNASDVWNDSFGTTQNGIFSAGTHNISSGAYSLDIVNSGTLEITVNGQPLRTGQKYNCHVEYDPKDRFIDYCDQVQIVVPSGGEAWFIAYFPSN